MILPLVQHVANVRGERDEAQQVLAEEPLALIGAALGEDVAGSGQLDRSALELGELKNVQRLGEREQVVDLETRAVAR